MNYGNTWPAGKQSGGPAVTLRPLPVARAPQLKPMRDRYARVLAYEVFLLDREASDDAA